MTSSSSELLDSAMPETCLPLFCFVFSPDTWSNKVPCFKEGNLSWISIPYSWKVPNTVSDRQFTPAPIEKKEVPINYLLALAPAHLLKLIFYLAFSHTLCLLAVPGAPQLVLRPTLAFALLSAASALLPDCHLTVSLSGFRTQLGWGLLQRDLLAKPIRCCPITQLFSVQPSHRCDAFLCTDSFTSFPLVFLATMMLFFHHHNPDV